MMPVTTREILHSDLVSARRANHAAHRALEAAREDCKQADAAEAQALKRLKAFDILFTPKDVYVDYADVGRIELDTDTPTYTDPK